MSAESFLSGRAGRRRQSYGYSNAFNTTPDLSMFDLMNTNTPSTETVYAFRVTVPVLDRIAAENDVRWADFARDEYRGEVTIVFDGYSEVTRALLKLRPIIINSSRRYLVNVNDKWVTLTPDNLATTLNNLVPVYNEVDVHIEFSDAWEELISQAFGRGTITIMEYDYMTRTAGIRSMEVNRNRPGGAFFPYTHSYEDAHLSAILERLGCFSSVTPRSDNCIIEACMHAGMEDAHLDHLRQCVKRRKVSLVDLKKFAENINICITVYVIGKAVGTGKKSGIGTSKIFNGPVSDDKQVIRLALYEDHYFINEVVEVNKWALANYEKIKNRERWWEFRSDKKRDKRYMHSFELLYLIEKTPITGEDSAIFLTYYQDRVNLLDCSTLDYPETAVRPFRKTERTSDAEEIVFFDIETSTKSSNDIKTCVDLMKIKVIQSCDTVEKGQRKLDDLIHHLDSSDLEGIKKRLAPYCPHSAYLICSVDSKGNETVFSSGNLSRRFLNHLATSYGVNALTENVNKILLNYLESERENHSQIYDSTWYTMVNAIKRSKLITSLAQLTSMKGIGNKLTDILRNAPWDQIEELELEDEEEKKVPSVILCAHNASYDWSVLLPYLRNINIVNKGTRMVCGSGLYSTYPEDGRCFKVRLVFKDSSALIPMPLKSFGKSFNLKIEKEVMPHAWYTDENVLSRFADEDELRGYIDDDEYDILISNLIKHGCRTEGGVFDMIKYSIWYCLQDCRVLKDGYNTFRDSIQSFFKLDINAYPTLSSLSDQVMTNNGVYGDVPNADEYMNKDFIEWCTVLSEVVRSKDQSFQELYARVCETDNVSELWCRAVVDSLKSHVKEEVEEAHVTIVIEKLKTVDIFLSDYETMKKKLKLKLSNHLLELLKLAPFDVFKPNPECVLTDDRVCEVSGVPLQFIKMCSVGGRTMCRDNQRSINTNMADFDAVSLYPSAMVRLANELGGVLKGTPKVWNETIDLSKVDGYFLEVEILKVGRKLPFPTTCLKEKGGNNWTNNLGGKNLFVDKIKLENMIRHQKVEYKILRGYYYDQGRDNRIGEAIQYMFEKRKHYKDKTIYPEGNPLQLVLKLILNCAYGICGLKEIDTDVKYVSGKNFDVFCKRNYDRIKCFNQLGKGEWRFELYKEINAHYNRIHVAAEILSMSKVIMDEVMVLAEELRINVTYTDTDSIHVTATEVPRLAEKFKNLYGRDLIGNELGQFHTDFSFDGTFSIENGYLVACNTKEVGEIVASRSIIVAKKTYIDELEDDAGNRAFHIRMKGIPIKVFQSICNRVYNGDPIALFMDLYNGKAVIFDFNLDGNFVWKRRKDHVTYSCNMTRCVQFFLDEPESM